MKKKILIAVFAGTTLSGCYTHMCPTYAVKPEKKQEIKANPDRNIQQKDQSIPS